MSDTQQLPLSIQPVISYPREAQVGKTYLMTIDLQPSGNSEWLYEDEEYPIYCMLETSPLFSSKPVGEPAVVLHRFGGSYGAAQFLLTATQEEMEGEIKVTLVNGWGFPLKVLCLNDIKITTIVTRKNIVDYIGVKQKEKVKKITPSDKEELQNHSRKTYIEKWINNLENEIASYQAALEVYTREAFPRDWAMIQNNLGHAYLYRIQGEKADNLETAIAYFQASLQVFTIEGFPRDWARTQNNLANAYMNRIRGDRAENLEVAIASYQAALEVYTREAFPRDWAMIQNNLGHAYLYRLRGEKADNLERMIAHFQAALEVYTRTAFPSQWATIQNNLGTAYGDRIQGERAENLEIAITSYQAALEVYTREAFPRNWAMTQNNLGNAYTDRIQGDRAENLESAITSYQAALQVLTIEEFPRAWAMTQNNLGNAYTDRIQGDRTDNLERAIAYYQTALQVYTREAFPREWAGVQTNLGNVYSDRTEGEKADDLERAIAYYQAALEVYTRETFPSEWAEVYNNLKTIISLDLAKFYQACNPSPLKFANPQDQKYYINLSSVRGGNTIKQIGRTITRLSPHKPTCQLFTGYIGCGKSTELQQLKLGLEKQGCHVVYFESSHFLEMADVDVTDILLAIARSVAESLEAVKIRLQPAYFVNLFREIGDFLQTPIELSIAKFSLPGGIAKITTKMKDSPRLRSQLRQYLEPRTNGILKAINQEVLTPATEKLKRIGKKGLVVIIDNLDRLENTIKPTGEPQPVYLFVDRGEQLKQLNCHVVYTIPLCLIFSNAWERLTNRFAVVPKVLPMVTVQLRQGGECKEGIALLQQMVLARAFPDMNPVQRLDCLSEVFDHPDTLKRLCQISGGHTRQLLMLIARCLERDDPPFSRDCIEDIIRQRRNQLTLAIAEDEWIYLREVAQQKSLRGEEKFQILIRDMFVFEYRDSQGSWFDINPILAEAEEFQL